MLKNVENLFKNVKFVIKYLIIDLLNNIIKINVKLKKKIILNYY
jgi:hypothetical protein